MKIRTARRLSSLAALLALTGFVGSAEAADMDIKDYGGAGGVPVPAPAPIPYAEAEWYVGVFGGGILKDDASVEDCGGCLSIRENRDKILFGGISAGRYIMPNVRAEIEFAFYDSSDITNPAEFANPNQVAAPIDGTNYVAYYDETRTDRIKVGRTTGMFNLYYDIPLSQRFKPYIGGGVGFSWRNMKRTSDVSGVCDHSIDVTDNTFVGTACAGVPGSQLTYSSKETQETDRFDLALAAMAGLSYELTPDIMWDTGYQLLWESNSLEMAVPTAPDATSIITYGNSVQHSFRTGLRFQID